MTNNYTINLFVNLMEKKHQNWTKNLNSICPPNMRNLRIRGPFISLFEMKYPQNNYGS